MRARAAHIASMRKQASLQMRSCATLASMSTTIPRQVSFTLLGELQERWRASGWPGAELLNPGLSDAEIDAATAPLGLRLPEEVRMWWRWHDGSSAAVGQGAAIGAADRWYPPLSEAIRHYTMMRDVAATLGAENVPAAATREVWWPRDLFPITWTGAGTVTACDCSVRHDAPSPIHTVDFHDGPAGPPRAPSLGTLVLWWIMAIDTGAWFYDADERRWEYDWELVEHARQIGNAI